MKIRFPDEGESERLRLRPLTPDDIDNRYLAWFKDEEVVRYLEVRNLTRSDSVAFLRRGEETGLYRIYAICLKETGEHIGNIKLGEVRPTHGVSDLVTVIGARAHWGKGYATEAIRLATQFAFNQLDLRKLSAGIYSGNIGSAKAYLRAGWIIEGVLHAQFIRDGATFDELVVGCFNPKYFGKLPPLPKSVPTEFISGKG